MPVIYLILVITKALKNCDIFSYNLQDLIRLLWYKESQDSD